MPDQGRNCTDCGQVDLDPRHQQVLADGAEAYHHLDCGARRNPPCDQCAPQLEGWDGTTGEGLRKHIMSGAK